MKRIFIETEGFRKQQNNFGDDSLLSTIQNDILQNPKQGKVIIGTGGVRKLRIRKGSKGKRGGFRVIYLDLPEADKTYLIWLYTKNEDENISSSDKKIIKKLVTTLKKEARS